MFCVHMCFITSELLGRKNGLTLYVIKAPQPQFCRMLFSVVHVTYFEFLLQLSFVTILSFGCKNQLC